MATEQRLINVLPLMKNGWHLERTGESNVFLQSMSLADVPTVDAVEVVHGRWIYEPVEFSLVKDIRCSVCRRYVKVPENYCPNCGAIMDGDTNG